MPDPLADAVSGTLSPFVSKLDTINTVLRSARQTRQSARGALLGGQQFGTPEPQTLVWIRNDTGSALSAFSVVALGTPVISAVDYPHTVRQYPVFPATAPAATTDCFAILIEPAEAYTTGTDGRPGMARAAIMGVMPCDISVSDTTHAYATPTAGATGYLTSSTSGPAQIIWKESGTGTKRAVVLVNQAAGGAGTTVFLAKLTTSSGEKWKWYKLKLNTSGAYTNDGSEATDYNAVPCKIDGTDYSCYAQADLRVWMKLSAGADGSGNPQYEFLPVGLGMVVQTTGAYSSGYPWKLLSWDGSAFVDASPSVTGTNLFEISENQGIPTGTNLLAWPAPGTAGALMCSSNLAADPDGAYGVGPGWIAGLYRISPDPDNLSDCLLCTFLGSSGISENITGPQSISLAYNSGTQKWESTDTFAYDGGTATVKVFLTDGRVRCTINDVDLVMDAWGTAGGVKFIDFAGGWYTGLGSLASSGTKEDCGGNTFRVRITCACCPITTTITTTGSGTYTATCDWVDVEIWANGGL